ncbi:App1 family protein [Nitrosococcus wardiae]|uniref:App1 family protein n=1 Tax=Nitrosococcus wardiae TaxID=1814290 RepID=UPI001F102A09|nr:phosphatase domain-containing protein [Nitrosococcus wardiae]
MLKTIAQALRRAVHVLARPVKSDRGRGGIVIQPYRGYGSRKEVFLMGRVFKQRGNISGAQEGALGRDLMDIARRLLRRGIAEAVLTARFQGREQQVIADRDGYFHVHLQSLQPPAEDRLWHHLDLKVIEPLGAMARGDLFIPPSTARYVMISDIDDTVMYTGVANKIKMLWRLFVQGPHSRVAFPGVAAFYRALHNGVAGTEQNPVLYVSRGPWSLYEVLDEFFHLHGIPIGPILFLRDWGFTPRHPFPRRREGHKLALIRDMLALYQEQPFILIGDSGQRDPEIYSQIVQEHPGRVLAIYIRHISHQPERHQEIEALAKEVVNAGSTLLLAADSFAMAEHAVEHGLIAPEAVSEVIKEREQQQGEPDLKPTRKIKRNSQKALERGELEETLEQGDSQDTPPNVVVESEERERRSH